MVMCDSRETVPAAIALALLASGDPVTAVTYGANFGRDADTIACMAGYICGAFTGLDRAGQGKLHVPPGIAEGATGLAGRLVDVGKRLAADRIEASQVLAAI
jgi:hypothetical protein